MTADQATADRTATDRPGAGSAAEHPAAVAALTGLVREVRDRALAWTEEHLAGFVLPEDVLEPHTKVDHTLKPLGELAQLCSTAQRVTAPGDPARATADRLVAFAWEQTRSGDLMLELLRSEPFAAYPFEIYAAFAGHGLRHEGFERLARRVAATRGWAFTEQHANRQLGLINSERRVGIAPHADAEAVLRRTWLGGLCEPWMLERASGYSLTHAAYHVTDWGIAPERMPADLDLYLRDWLPPWVDGCLESDQWDLTAELLAVGAGLPGAPPVELFAAAWPVLARVQHPSGCLPETGPPVPPGDAADEEPYPFLACYHSTLVTVFAASLTVARLEGPRTSTRSGREHSA
ncbi:hypothetical protein OG599_20510 [Streptomyces sp. NBC_01335]|uniref:DUF6895 family protein n=1 Tax=Streptomyces sp. NBC_01335 TaxID=2903828 RepID=UPI002E0F8C81|nr:hypothetical protein OG599_20510 [Streptomyces sp. NBC_01335]